MELKNILILTFLYIAFRIYMSRTSGSSTSTEPHGKVTNVDNEAVFKALTSSGPVVVDFFATWCGPCKAAAPKVGELSEKYGNVRFIQVDVDKVRSVAQQMVVTAMPTFVFMMDGKEIQRVRGADLKAMEKAIIDLERKRSLDIPSEGKAV
ncbi:Thioredoxin [Penicillium lagena]|uniref:Thioredoxin n=1 Tax=Penicillium lagena TaxID=94218 RepID=UPI00253F719C|nr:Thioredoxin [Penicillium lagena]KAJ5619108.1 Thioredoxin [Penicillium lagena]